MTSTTGEIPICDIDLFARNPEQWTAVRESLGLISSAFHEVLRPESPVQLFARVTTRDHETGEVTLPGGRRVVVLYGSADRDELKYPESNRFDVTRSASDHLAFGYGMHVCAGQGLARLEGHAVLRALARHVERIELAGPPKRRLANITRSPDALPLRVL